MMNTKTEEIQDFILMEIEKGNYLPNQKIPTESNLAKAFNTSITSAHRAIKILEKKGIVKRIRHHGSYIKKEINTNNIKKYQNGPLKYIHVIYSRANDQIHWRESTLRALQENVKRNDYSVKYVDFDPKNATATDFYQVIKSIVEEGSAGIIMTFYQNIMEFIGDSYFLLKENNIPFIFHNRRAEYIPNLVCNSISMDPFADGIKVGQLVKQAGYKQLFFLMMHRYSQQKPKIPQAWVNLRYEGVKFGFGNGRVQLIKTEKEFPEICRNLKNNGRKRQTCLVALNDISGAHFIDCARNNDLNIPEDCELIAFDDNPELLTYNITTLAAPLEKIGRMLGEMVCNKDESIRSCTNWVKIPYELIERETFRINNSGN